MSSKTRERVFGLSLFLFINRDTMKKNYFTPKTGHEASDEFFSNLAIWHDIDMIKSFVWGFAIGILVFTVMIGII